MDIYVTQNLVDFVGSVDDMRIDLQAHKPYMGEDFLMNLLNKATSLEVGDDEKAQELKASLVKSIEETIALNTKRITLLSELLQMNAETFSAGKNIRACLTKLQIR